jgi:integrase
MRERSPGVWELRVFVGTDPITGVERTKSKTFRGGKREATSALAALVTSLSAEAVSSGRRKVAPAKMTLTGLLEAYLEQFEGSPGTSSSYQSMLSKHIKPTIGRLPLHDVDARILDRFYKFLRDERGLAPSSIRSVHALIRGALRQATVWGWVASNVARDARPPTVRRGEIKLPEAAQIVLAIETACERDPDFGVFLRLAAATGARRGELCAATWAAIDLVIGTIRIDTSALAVTGKGVSVKDTKTHTRRTVTLDEGTVMALRDHRARMVERVREVAGQPLADTAYVFSHAARCDKPWRPETVSSRWDTVRGWVGLDHVRLHDLRHFQATKLLQAGVPAANVSKRLGHRDTATTLNVYAQFLETEDRRSADLMGDLFPPSDPPPT